MSKYLVTGGAGFIGSYLCKKLISLGHEVVVLDDLSTGKISHLPSTVQFVHGDVRDFNTVLRCFDSVDGCFHLAAIASVPLCHESWMNAFHVNVTGTMNVFESARHLKQNGTSVRIVYASSAAVYGDSTSFPLNENTAQPISFYGMNKFMNEELATMAYRTYDLQSVGLRLFNVYGLGQHPHSSYTGVITIFLNRLQEKNPIVIYGDGKQSRDFIYVEDVVDFFIQAMNVSLCCSEVVNVCSGCSVTIQEVAEEMARCMKVVPEFQFEKARSGDIYRSVGDPKHAEKVLGLRIKTGFGEGLRRLVGAR